MTHACSLLLLAILAAGPGAGPAWAQPDQDKNKDKAKTTDQQAERRARPSREAVETKVLTIERDAVLSVFNLSGDTEIAAAPGSDLKLTITRRGYGDTDEEAQAALAATGLDVRQHAGRVEIRTMPHRSTRRASVRLTITGPAALAVDARSMSGDIALTGVAGDARLETMSGDIVARELARLSSAKTVSGDITVTGCAATAEISLATVNGDVNATGVKAPSCDVGSVSGEVGLKEFTCERAVVRSVSGGVGYGGSLARSGRYEFKSHSGDVRVVVDGKTGFDLEARTYSGALRSELPLSARSTTGGEGGHGRRTLSGVFGDGSAEVSVTTFSGDVTILKKQ